jgi:hypothetical protein
VLATLTLILMTELDPNRRVNAEDDIDPLSLVSESAAVCLEVSRCEAVWTKLQSSRLAARLKQFPPVDRFLSGSGFQQWTLVDEYVRRTTGKALSEHLLGAFAESLVLAVYLPEGKPPEGVVIARARDSDALKQALRAWAILEPSQDSQSRDHRGHTYVRRAKSATSSQVVYYTTFGRTFAFSDHERLIQQVIDFQLSTNRKDSVAAEDAPRVLRDLKLYQTSKARLPADAAAFVYINPRRWDKVIDEAIRRESDATWIQPVSRHISAISGALRLDDEVVLDLVADTTSPDLPAAWRLFVASTNGGGDWQQRIPADSLLAVSSRLDVAPLIQAWLNSAPEARSEEFKRGRAVLKSLLLGSDFPTEILPRILRDWTIVLAPATDSNSDTVPLSVVGQFLLDSEKATADQTMTVQPRVDNALQFGFTFVAALLSHQRGDSDSAPVLVETESIPAGIVRSLGGLPLWSPSYHVTSNQLTLATSRGALISHLSPTPKSESNRQSRLAACEQRYFQGTTQLAWLDAVAVRTLLNRQKDWIAGQLAASSESSSDGQQRVRKHLANIEQVANLFDAAFIAAQLHQDHVHIVLGAALDQAD